MTLPTGENADWITPYLAQGGHFGTTVEQAYKLARVVVFCAMELQPDATQRPPPGCTEIRLPFDDTLDATKVPWRDILRCAGRLRHEITQQRRVLVMCAQGRNRSGLVVGLTLRHTYGLDGPNAISLIEKRRHPLHGRPLANPVFRNLIIRGMR